MRNSSAAPSLLLLLILSASIDLCFCTRYSILLEQCNPSSYLHGSSGSCNRENGSGCCRGGESYAQYHCSPPVTDQTPAKMTVNSFARGGDGGGASECESRFFGDDEKVVALSTGWYNRGSRCSKNIRIHANGKSVLARVVDECDSVNGCDNGHSNQPPCRNNIVDASPAVWRALGISMDVGEYHIIWSEA